MYSLLLFGLAAVLPLQQCFVLLPSHARRASTFPLFAGTSHFAKPSKRPAPNKLPDLSQAAFPIPPESGYDLIVIGSGPGGEAAAVYAAKLGKKVI